MRYYRFQTVDGGENIVMTRINNRDVHSDGKSINPPDEIFNFRMHAGDDYGYDQYDPFFEGEIQELTIEERLSDYYVDFLMSKKLVDMLVLEGVDNLQLFPVSIIDEIDEEVLNVDYFFVNILGELSNTRIEYTPVPSAGERHMHNLIVDKNEIAELQMFRPAESFSEIVIHEKLASLIEKNNQLNGFRLEELRVIIK